MRADRLVLVLLVAFVVLASACQRSPARALARQPRIADAQLGCSAAEDPLRPLLIEWPSVQRGSLEAEFKRGDQLVVVRYSGCELEVVRGCRAHGHYEWTAIEPKHETLTLRDANDIQAKVPLGAASLVAALRQHGALRLDMTLIGQYASRGRIEREALTGSCDEATHVVSALLLGAFELGSQAGAELEAGAEIRGAGARGRTAHERGYHSSDGDRSTCRAAGWGPPEGCSALVKLELEPLGPNTAKRCPPDMALVSGGLLLDSNSGQLLAPYCLDLHEVTVADYAACADAHECSPAATGTQDEHASDEQRERFDPLCNQAKSSRRQHPVNCINWHQAAAYCRAQGKRLPTAGEWENAARGGDQARSFPWGEDPPSKAHLNACGRECEKEFEELGVAVLFDENDGFVGTAPVGSFARKATGRWELLDLAGNVWEWTSSGSAGGQLARGGGALSGDAWEVGSEAAVVLDPGTRRFDVGVRCAADPE